MSKLPSKDEYDYLIYRVSDSLEAEEKLWLTDWRKVVKRLLFKKFDGWVQSESMKKNE